MTKSDSIQTQTQGEAEAPAHVPGGGGWKAVVGPGGSRRGGWRLIALVALATVAGAVVGALALYGMKRLPGNAPAPQTASADAPAVAGSDAACADAPARAAALAPLVAGDIAALQLARAPRRLPALDFTDAAGAARSLDDFKGRVLLVNLWASWCVPCRAEMPGLDRLEAEMGGPSFQVVPINLDTRDPQKAQNFLKEVGATHLPFYSDPHTRTFQALRSVGRGFGLPTTLLVDEKGCELGFLAGPAVWDGAAAKTLIGRLVAKNATLAPAVTPGGERP